MIQTKTRITWVDMAKGYGILFVILSHIGVEQLGFIRLFSFHMPLFFFLSGFVFRDNCSFTDFFKKKVKTIIVPYFCLGTVIIIFRAALQRLPLEAFLETVLDLLVQRRFLTLWYLTSLLWLNLFYFVVHRHCSQRTIAIMCVVFPILGLIFYSKIARDVPWNADIILMALPFFACGHYYSSHPALLSFASKTKRSTVCWMLFSLMVNYFCDRISVQISGEFLNMAGSHYGVPCLSYAAAFAGICAVVLLSQLGTIEPVLYLGKNSMLYFAWHQSILKPISIKILSLCHFTLNESTPAAAAFCYHLLQLAIILAAAFVLNELISKSKLRFMLGKS